ncbi:uncharacterized protein LOC112198762 [Rosa chinensis]|uniref:uncharacterized protein LOC112198762 n=1 Tax=Rosa chinensis TaxID=74649 RepID=UPI001AD93E40|nr:uncharacterized protein LOC112198762 [Rosa chinensis]
MSSEAGTMEAEKVLKLKEKLSECRLLRKQLLKERELWRIKERKIKELQEELRVEIEANSRATSEFEEKKKTLKEALQAKRQSVRQVKKALDEFNANRDREFAYKGAQIANASGRFDRLHAELGKKINWSEAEAERDYLDKLQSEIDEKWDNLIAFLETCRKNSKITDDVKPCLRVHYDAYIKTLKSMGGSK